MSKTEKFDLVQLKEFSGMNAVNDCNKFIEDTSCYVVDVKYQITDGMNRRLLLIYQIKTNKNKSND